MNAIAMPVTTPGSIRSEGSRVLAELESEAITIIREVAAETRAPVLLFSGGKDNDAASLLKRFYAASRKLCSSIRCPTLARRSTRPLAATCPSASNASRFASMSSREIGRAHV